MENKEKSLTLDAVADAVCEVYFITKELLKSSSRERYLTSPREAFYYFAYKHCDVTTAQLAEYLNRKQPTINLRGDEYLKKIRQRVDTLAYFNQIAEILQQEKK